MARREVRARAAAGRLLVIGGLFTLAVLAEVYGQYSSRTLASLYALLIGGFTVTLAQAIVSRSRDPSWLGPAEAGGDLLLITALVYCTGGSHSIFGFVYIGWIVYVATRLGPGGAVAAAGLSTLVYGYTVTGLALGWFVPPGGGTVGTLQDALGSLTRHSLAFLASGLLCARLAREVRLGRTQLRELGEMYRKIVDNVSSGLMTVDREGRIASFNREAERITGWGREEAVGTALAAVLPTVADRVRGTETSDDDSIGVPGEVAARRAVAATVRGGRELFLGFSTSPLRGEKGEPEGQIVIFQDLTRVVEMERRLRLSERLAAVGQLAAGLAHEVRNPLASLSGAIELLERETRPAAESSVRLFGIVQRETRRLNRLVSDFLDFARPSPPRPGSVPLLSLLEEVRDLIGRGGPNTARVEIDVADGCVVVGDRDQLHQLLWNLLLNAVQAEPRDDTVRVRARLETSESGDPTVEVTVEDRGQGIPAEVLSQVFDPFFTTKAKGTGLGLATVHRILEAHGGSAEISSQVGEGTTVRVRLPAGES